MHVILIHGQGRTPLSMIWLARRLRRQGHHVHYFGYLAWAQSFETIVNSFIQTIRAKTRDQRYAIVSHSLGGIISRAALPRLADNPPEHLIMLAPPNQQAAIAKTMVTFGPYRWLTRDCGQKLGDEAFYRTLPPPLIPTTIMAGTRGWPGWLSPFDRQPNDLVLTVDETKLAGCQQILVHATHTLIMNSKQVAQLISEILASENATQPVIHSTPSA
jgi:hypothetical protein